MKLKRKTKPTPLITDLEQNQQSAHQKRKSDVIDQRDSLPASPPVEKRLRTSSEVTILDRLRGLDPVGALKEIVAAGGETAALIDEFLSHGGQAGDVLRLLESEEKTKSPEVALVFQAVESVLLHVASGRDREDANVGGGGVVAQDLIRKVLHGHFRYVMLLLSPSNTAYQAKSCLRLLSAMVATAGTAGAREILTKIDFEHKNFVSVVKRRGKKDEGAPGDSDVRTCYIHFLLAFMVSGNAALTKDFLEKKSNISQVFPGLIHDSCETVTLVLTTLREKIVENSSVSKTYKMKLFGVFNLKPLLQLFHWKGAFKHDDVMSDSEKAEYTKDLERVSDSVSSLFKSLLTSTKLGIVFHDPTCGNSGKNLNHLLQNLLKSFEKPWEQPQISDVIAGALRTCPDQLRPYFSCLEKVWSPRFTDCWLQVVDFIYVLFKRQDILITTSELDSKQPKLIASVIANVGFPERVLKEVVIPAMEHEHDMVRRKGVDLLSLLVGNLTRALDGVSQSMKKSVIGRLTERIPTAHLLHHFWEKEVAVLKSEENNTFHHLACAASALDFACTHYPQRYTAQSLDLPSMLDQMMELTSADEAHDVKLVLLSHLARSASESVKRRDILELLLSVYASSEGENGRKRAAGTLVEVLRRASVLAESEMASVELELWLHHLPRGSEVEDPARRFLATQLAKQLSESGNEDVMRLFLQRSSLGLNPVSVGLLEASRDQETVDLLSPYLDDVLQSIVAIHEEPLDMSKEFLKGKFIKSTSKFLKNASHSRLQMDADGTGSFVGLLNAFRMLLAVRLCKREEDCISALVELEGHIAGLPSKEGTAAIIVQQPFVQSLFQPFSESERTDFVLKMISLAGGGKSDASSRIELAFRDKCDSEVFGADAGASGKCSGEIIHKCFETLRPSQASLCNLLVKSLECSARAPSELRAISLAAILTSIVNRRLTMSREAEEAIRLHLPTVLVQTADIPATRGYIFPPVATLLRHNPYLNSCISVEKFEELCRATGYGGHDFGLIESLVAEREELSASFQEFVLSEVEPKSVIGNVQEALLRSLTVSRPRKKMLKFLTTSLKKNLSLCTSVDERLIQLLEITCEKCEQDLSGMLSNPANVEDVKVLRSLLIIGKSGHKPQPSAICERILKPGLGMAIKSLKKSDQDEGASIADLIIALAEVFAAEESCCLREYIEDDLWTSFVKAVLKTCLKSSLDGTLRSRYINGLAGLARLRYSNETEEDRVESSLIYNMIYGHSNFVPMVMDTVDAHGEAKTSVLRLILMLTKTEPSACTANHIPVYLGAYHGTLSHADQAILGILCQYESRGGSLSQFKPLLWGQSALGHYSARQKAGVGAALWKVPKTSEILALIESERMIRSAFDFPLRLELRPDASDGGDGADDDRTRYDPRFFLPLLCQMCSPGVYIDRHLHLVECGALALVFASFSSRDKNMRSVGYVALARIYQQLEAAKLSAEKKVWLHLVDMVRNGVRASKSAHIQTLRIPSLVTNFLSRICHVLRSPLDPMYKSISSFVLAKPALELFKVPEFLRLFQSRELNHEEERRWILAVIRDGMRDEIDYSVAQKDFFIKMLLSFHDCTAMSDEGSRSLVRQIVGRAAGTRKAAYDLVRHQGLLGWLCGNVVSHSSDGRALAELAGIASTAWCSIGGGDEKGDGEKVPSTVLSEFSLTLDALAAACQLAGGEAALKCIVPSLRAISARKSLVSQRDVVIYSRRLLER